MIALLLLFFFWGEGGGGVGEETNPLIFLLKREPLLSLV